MRRKISMVYKSMHRVHKPTALLAIIGITALGTYLLTGSHAATPYASVTAANGSLSSGATSDTNCSGAANGSCVTFGSSANVPMDGNVALALSSSGTPFAANSFWNTPLPDNTPMNPNSGAYVNDIMAADCANYPNGSAYSSCPKPNHVGLAVSCWSAPLYIVPANQSTVMLTIDSNNKSMSVPIPADAHAAGGTDGEMQIYQPSTDSYWDFWRVSSATDNAPGAGDLPWSLPNPVCGGKALIPVPSHGDSQWHASWGGVITSVSQSDGIFPNHTGATATSIPLLGAVARIDEFRAGQINHVLGLELPANLCPYVIPTGATSCPTSSPRTLASNTISWPATRSDGVNINALAVPEGLRFRLPANLNLDQYNLTPMAKLIAVAAQKYGFVLYDSTGDDPNNVGGISIRLGDPTAYTTAGLPDPYTSGVGVGGVNNSNQGLFGGKKQYQIMANFPWDQLVALPFNYGGSGGP